MTAGMLEGILLGAALLAAKGHALGRHRLAVVVDATNARSQPQTAPDAALVGVGPSSWVRRLAGRRRAPAASPDAGRLIAHVSAALRAGASPAGAWRGAGVGCDEQGVPLEDGLVGAGVDRSSAAAVAASCRLAHELGTPLAAVLDTIGEVIADGVELAGERAAEMAGPRTSARVLTWLPLLGLGLGAAMGADPVGVLLGGGVGSAALVCGVALIAAGRRWTGALVHSAERAGVR